MFQRKSLRLEKQITIFFFTRCNMLPCIMHTHVFGPNFQEKNLSFYFLLQLFIFRNKTDYRIPGYYFAYGYCYCFLELHFECISINKRKAFIQIWNQYYSCIMHTLIFPPKIWAEKCTLYTTKYGNFLKFMERE